MDSNAVAAIGYLLNSEGDKYSLIALPLANTGIADAAALAAHIGTDHVGAMLKWNPATQAFRLFVPPNTGDNFSVAPGDAIFVTINAGGPDRATLAGDVVETHHALTAGAEQPCVLAG